MSYINNLIIKIASRCNLNCRYCYMYNKGDSSYLRQPKVMSSSVITKLIEQAFIHATTHEVKTFNFIFHGGEPLLAGKKKIEFFINTAISEFNKRDNIQVNFSLQTNGLLLDDEWCDIINKYRIKLGISLDGGEEANDMNRIDHRGKGSYEKVMKRFKASRARLDRPPAILTVINPNYDPIEILDHFTAHGVRVIDFLLPDNNYQDPPLKASRGIFANSETPYADWIIRLYDYWKNLKKEIRPSIRTFNDIYWKFLGGTIECDILGNDYNRALVIETDGGVEAVDSLKICGESFTKENSNIFTYTIDEALNLPLVRLYFNSHKSLCRKCNECILNEFCGGGFIAHRYRKSNRFDNPSVYCEEYIRFLSHIQNDLINSMEQELLSSLHVQEIDLKQTLEWSKKYEI
jgi:uncharacterized protein